MAVDGRARQQPADEPGTVRSIYVRHRAAPGVDDATSVPQLRCKSVGSASHPDSGEQARRGVQFMSSDRGGVGGPGGGNSNTDDIEGSDASSGDDVFTRGRGPKSRVLELPALPGGAIIASAKGGGGGSAASAGLTGVTLAFLESLRTASCPSTTLRDLYWSLVLPATRANRCAYVALLGAEQRARSTHVVVCSWDERICDVVDCVTDYLAAASSSQPPDPSSTGTSTSAGAGAGAGAGGSSGRLALRRSIDYPPSEHPAGIGPGGSWTSLGAPGLSVPVAWNLSRSPSPGPSPGASAAGSVAAGPLLAVWLDLFAVNFHPPTAGPAGAAVAGGVGGGGFGPIGGFGAAGRLSISTKYMPSLDDAAVERARALPSAVAAIRSVVLLPGAQGMGLREPAVALAAWHALRGRGCSGSVALAVAAPGDVDMALTQAGFEGLSVSAAKTADDGGGGMTGHGIAAGSSATESAAGTNNPNRPPSPTHSYAMPDRLAVRAAREGAAGAATAAVAATAIYAVDPLPSRTVREGLTAVAVASANACLSRPVGLGACRPPVLAPATSLPPAPAAPVSPMPLPPSTPQPHSILQTRSVSVNALELPSSYSPSPLSTSRMSLLRLPLRFGSGAYGIGTMNSRTLLLAGEACPPPPPPAAAATSVSPPRAPSGPVAGVALSLLRAPSGRSASFNSLWCDQAGKGPDDGDGDSGGGADAGTAGAKDSPLRLFDGNGVGGIKDRRGRTGSAVSGNPDIARGGWTAAAAASSDSAAAGGGEASSGFRRPRNLIPPLDVSVQSLSSPSALPPALSPAFGDHLGVGCGGGGGGSGSGRLMQLRNSAVAPWEASPPLPAMPVRAAGGLAVRGGTGPCCDGGGGGEMPPSPKSACITALPSRHSMLEPPAPQPQPLPRLAALHMYGAALPLASAPSATVAAVAAVGENAAAVAASAPLPAPLQLRDFVLPSPSSPANNPAAVAALPTPFGRIRRGYSSKGLMSRVCLDGESAAPNEALAAGGAGVEFYPDRDPGLPSDPDPEDADSESEGAAIVLDSMSSFVPNRRHPGGRENQEIGSLQPVARLQSYNGSNGSGGNGDLLRGSGGSGGLLEGGKAQLAPSPGSGNGGGGEGGGGAIGGTEARSLPSVPNSPPKYDLAPYRSLAPDLARLVGLGRLLAALGQHAMALRVVRHAMSAARSFHSSNHPDTARCAAALGGLMVYCQEQQQQQQGLARTQKSGVPDSGGGTTSVQRTRSPPARALPSGTRDRSVMFECTSSATTTIGPTHFRPAVSPSRTRLGSMPTSPGGAAGSATGSWEEAESLLRGASAVLERFLGPDNEETLTARQLLAAALMKAARYDEAVSMLQRAVSGRAARRRPASEVVVRSALDLATCLAATGRPEEARKLLRAQLVRLQEDEDEAAAAAARGGRAPGATVAGVAPLPQNNGICSLSTAVASGGGGGGGGGGAAMPPLNLTSAPSFFGNRMSYCNGDGGPAVRSGAASGPGSVIGSGGASPVSGGGFVVQASSLAVSPSHQNSPKQPQQSPPRGLTYLKREELRAKCTHQLAELKTACGKAQAARILYRNAVQSYTTVYGSNHAMTASCMLSLAALSHSVREYGEALKLYRTVLELFVELYGPHHPITTRVSNRMGDLEEEMEEAEQEAVEVEVEVAPSETLRRGCCHRSLRNECQYLQQGAVDEADDEDEGDGGGRRAGRDWGRGQT
ncbi:hypothetical protein Vretimale_10034 [Volvox reticuliferus]|uniref:Uncharacterized protein n=2 Tax=Volvox reticuliferus TaxID=1737510 RepID=A0A8J4GDT0_9CHLO|nr:hypothetical protein Vretimale_10034 [Volvox reticuliferus]